MRNIKLTIEYDGKEFNGWQDGKEFNGWQKQPKYSDLNIF